MSELFHQWTKVVAEANWEKGRIISEFVAGDGNISDFVRKVGGITEDHAATLKRVWDRFGSDRLLYPFATWVHFFAALDWEDAPKWLELASYNRLSVREMRLKRFESS